MFRASICCLLLGSTAAVAEPGETGWKTVRLDAKFRAEGVAVADVNNDGKPDVLVGELWYEAPNWTPHEMQPVGDYKDGLSNYSRVFCCWAEDLNADGFVDLIVVDFPGKPAYWLENPRGQSQAADGKPIHWKKHPIWHSACNESPQYADLLGTGKRVLVMGYQPRGASEAGAEGRMAYFAPKPGDPYAEWVATPISEASVPPKLENGKPVPGTGKQVPGTGRFSHGLGVGDLNGDGRADVISVGGWWEQPKELDGKTPWKFHPTTMNDACSDLVAIDLDADGKMDIVGASAHRFGIWWYKQRATDSDGHPTFEKRVMFEKLVSETHALHLRDVDGDGVPDLVTGKRWWSHGKNEPGANDVAKIYLLRGTRAKDGSLTFTPEAISTGTGVGTQFAIADVDGDGSPDVVTANKNGVHIAFQPPK